jgi:hypothetical protein
MVNPGCSLVNVTASKESGFACASFAAGAQAWPSNMAGNINSDSTVSASFFVNFLNLLP